MDIKKINQLKKNRNKIDCEWHDNERREFYVDENMKVLPCCYYAAGFKFTPDPVFLEYSEKNPGWNDLSLNTMDDIIDSEIYQKHLWWEGWENNPSELCIRNCGWKYKSPDDFETDPNDPSSDD